MISAKHTNPNEVAEMNVIMQLLQFIQQHKVEVALAGGVILGLLLGLLIGYVLLPVEWYNATPNRLRSDFQSNYILGVAEQYADTGDLEDARTKLGVEFWEEDTLSIRLEEMASNMGGQKKTRLLALAQALETAPVVTPTGSDTDGGTGLRSAAMVCGAGLLVIAFVGGLVFLIKRLQEPRKAGPGAPKPRVPGGRAEPSHEPSWGSKGAPLAQFVTAYTLGDDHYDPSFSIELENGEFMGECGVGISETIGVGSPNKVTAFEIWLFDKNDIRTVTTVLMSEYAFHDEALQAKLAPKGEPQLAQVGETLVLETKSLRVQARIAESEYGAGDLPANSFFENLSVDLAAWVKLEQMEQLEQSSPGTAADFPTAPPTM